MKIIYAAFIILPIVMLALSVFIAVRKNAKGATGKKAFGSHLKVLGVLVVMLACLTVGAYAAQEPANDTAGTPVSDNGQVEKTDVTAPVSDGGLAKGLGYIAAALAVGLAGIGAGISIAAGSPAAIGATSEDPKMFGKAMIFCVLGEAIAIYGLVISFMILLV